MYSGIGFFVAAIPLVGIEETGVCKAFGNVERVAAMAQQLRVILLKRHLKETGRT